MTYTVTAPVVLAVNEGGQTHHVYRGGVIEWLSDEQSAYFLAEGLVVGEPSPDAADEGSDKPSKMANKATLVSWLVDNASKPDGGDYTDGELDELTKPELWDLIDAVE